MSDPHGPRPLDPYRTLQLHPRATHELVVQAYWILIADQKRESMTSVAAAVRIRELNAAYALLQDDDARAAYDAEHRLSELPSPDVRLTTERFGLLGLQKRTVTTVAEHTNFYDLLRVDGSASPEVIHVAHVLRMRRPTGGGIEDLFLSDLLDEALETLGDPERRALYDASLAPDAMVERAVPSLAPAVVEPAPRPVVQPSPAAEAPPPDSARQIPTLEPSPVAAASPQAVTAPTAAEKPSPVEAPLVEVPAMFKMEPALASAGPLPREIAEPPAARRDEPGAGADAATSRSGILKSARRYLRIGVRPAVARAPKIVEERRKTPRGPSAQQQTIEAENARLMTLLESGSHSAPVAANVRDVRGPSAVTDAPLAALVFVAGPRAGESIPLGAGAVTIGASDASNVVLGGDDAHVAGEHARMWLHGDRFVFRQIDGSGTVVAGELLTLPMVMLDDGDEIRIGVHLMRFEYRSR